MTQDEWTIEELAERVADALGEGYPGPASRRVREVPDRRTIRWYATIGLVDRPASMRGRTALYNRRHLLQLVAVKRLQAEGRSLSSVQEALLGAGDEALERIAGLAPPAGNAGAAAPTTARFWTAAPAAAAPATSAASHAEGPRPLPSRPALNRLPHSSRPSGSATA